MDFFDNGEPKKFFLLVQHFKMTIEASGTLIVNAKLQYLHRLLRGETLRQFDTVCFQVGILTPTYLNRVILGLGAYFPPTNEYVKTKVRDAPRNKESA